MSTNSLPMAANAAAPIQVGLTDSQSFELAQRVAKCFAMSTLVPKDYQNNLPNCVIALNMASRMGADPLMVIQNLHIVHGRPGWSAQFLIATFNKCGRFSAIRYEFVGQEGTDTWGCRAKATELATGEVLTGTTVTLAMAKKEQWYQKNGSKWQTMPEQMLMYRAASWFVRAYAPEIAMGLQTADELREVIDLDRDGDAFTLPPKGQTSADLNAMLHRAAQEPADEQQPPLAQAAQPEPPAQEPPFDQGQQPPILQPEGNGKKRMTNKEYDDMRADMVMELNEKGVNVAEIEKMVGAYSNKWTPKDIEKIRGKILPNLLAELAGA